MKKLAAGPRCCVVASGGVATLPLTGCGATVTRDGAARMVVGLDVQTWLRSP